MGTKYLSSSCGLSRVMCQRKKSRGTCEDKEADGTEEAGQEGIEGERADK